MKKLLLSASVLLLATGAFAQTTMSGSDARFGLKAGVTLPTYSGTGNYDADYKTNTGFQVTAFGDFGVGNNFFIQPAVSLQNKGAKLESTSTVGNATSTATWKQSVMAIEVPINAVLRIPTGDAGALQINAGPYVGFNISGKNKTEGNFTSPWATAYTSGESDLNFGSESGDDLKSVDFGVNAGLSYRTTSGFLVGGNYGWGLTNLAPNGNSSNKLQNRVLSFSVGYSF